MKFYPIKDDRRKADHKISWCMIRPVGKLGHTDTYCGRNISGHPAKFQTNYPVGPVCLICVQVLTKMGRS
jgi:hypothetical protein